MGSLKLTTASSGSVILNPANTASDVTITVPAVTGTMITTASTFGATGPAFSAYIATQQTLSSGVATKMQCATEEFDTASCYDNTTNYRFTPNVAGYYQVNGEYDLQSGSPTRALISVWKNGSEFKRGNDLSVSSGNLANGAGSVVSALIYLNGSTDYIELYAFYAGGGVLVGGNQTQCYFQAFLARAA